MSVVANRRQKDLPLALTKVDLQDNSQPISGDNIPVGMTESYSDTLSSNLGTDRPLQGGKCIVGLQGNDAYVSLPKTIQGNLLEEDFSMSLWIKRTGTEVDSYIIDSEKPYNSKNSIQLLWVNTARLSFRIRGEDTAFSINPESDGDNWMLGTTRHLTITYKKSEDSFMCYINGSASIFTFSTSTPTVTNTATDLRVLAIAQLNSSAYTPNTNIFGLSFSNRFIEADEANEIYNGLYNNNFTAKYNLDSTSETTVFDSSGNDNHGTIQDYYAGFWGEQDEYSALDEEGYTLSDGATYYLNDDATGLIDAGVFIPRLEGSTTKCVAYLVNGERADLQYKYKAPSRATYVESNCFKGDGVAYFTIAGLLTTDTIEVFGSSATPTIPVNGQLHIATNDLVYGLLIKRSGVDWAYYTFSSYIEDPLSYILANVLEINSAKDGVLIDGSILNRGLQSEYHYGELGVKQKKYYNHPITTGVQALFELDYSNSWTLKVNYKALELAGSEFLNLDALKCINVPAGFSELAIKTAIKPQDSRFRAVNIYWESGTTHYKSDTAFLSEGDYFELSWNGVGNGDDITDYSISVNGVSENFTAQTITSSLVGITETALYIRPSAAYDNNGARVIYLNGMFVWGDDNNLGTSPYKIVDVPILSDLTAFSDGTPLSSGVIQDGKSFLGTCKMQAVKTPRVVKADTINAIFDTDSNPKKLSLEESKFGGWENQYYSANKEVDRVSNIVMHHKELSLRQDITEMFVRNTAETDDPTLFIITVNMAAGETMVIPAPSTLNDFVYIDWEEVKQYGITGANPSYTYVNAGTYQIKLKGYMPEFGFNNVGNKLNVISADGVGDIGINSFAYGFYGCSNLVTFDLAGGDISNITTMASMFRSATSFDSDLSLWDVSSVTNFTAFMLNASLSTANYNALLNQNTGWGSRVLQDGGGAEMDFGNSTYSLSDADAVAGRAIIESYNWVVIDGGGI